jgi:hypothetical protein
LTHFGHLHTYDDAINALDELLEMTKESSEVYEIVIHEDDFKISVDKNQIDSIRSKVQSTFQQYKHGALAFVANIDLIFGLCRQLEIMMENDGIAVSAFRSEELARKWIKEMQTMQGITD